MKRVADFIIESIANEGVDHIFFVPGGQAVYLNDALRRCEKIKAVSMHHEQSAAMAALSYAEYNNNFGACVVTTGCAGTNTLTGVLHAWQDSVPMIIISGQQSYNMTTISTGLPLRQMGVQELDITSIAAHITKYAVTVADPREIRYHLEKAIYLAKNGRKGPVWIDVPLDVQNSMIDEESLKGYEPDYSLPKASEDDIEFVFNAIRKAERPVLMVGNGVRTSGAIEELRALLDIVKIPCVFTRLSYDILPYDHPLNYGIENGITGGNHRYSNFIVQNSDLFLSIGSRLAPDTVGSSYGDFARAAEHIVVDIDEVEHSKKTIRIDKLVIGDAKDFINRLKNKFIKESGNKQIQAWIDKCDHWKAIFPEYNAGAEDSDPIDSKYFMVKMSEAMPKNSVVVTDAGYTGASVPAATIVDDTQRILHSFAQGEMGYVLPGACGPATLTDAPIIAYTGDGSVMMNIQELQTVVRNRFNIKLVIMNNNGYSGVRHGQKAHFRGKSIGTDPGNGVDFPDYGKISDAFGIEYFKIEKAEDIDKGLERVFEKKAPFVLEVMTDPEQYDFHCGLVEYGKRKFGFRPIEDQSPYLDRDIFFKEMIIEPLETSSGKPV